VSVRTYAAWATSVTGHSAPDVSLTWFTAIGVSWPTVTREAYRQSTARTSIASRTPLSVSERGSDSLKRLGLVSLRTALVTKISSLPGAASTRAAMCTPRLL
jgi:hypothetical protein